MKTRIVTIIALSLALATIARAQVPGILNYQGRVSVNGTNFNGTGQFSFALVDGGYNAAQQATAVVNFLDPTNGIESVYVTFGGAGYTSAPTVTITDLNPNGGSNAVATAFVGGGVVTNISIDNAGQDYSGPTITIAAPPPDLATNTLWSNDGSSVAGSQPTLAVPLPVSKGLYSVLLGDTTISNMTVAVTASVFSNSDVNLRVWFNDGVHGFQQLAPDQRIAAAGYALVAGSVSATSALNLPTTTSSSSGVLLLGGVPFLHAYGEDNTFVGASAGNFTTSGQENTATGARALLSNTTGDHNTANGTEALESNTQGTDNTATGAQALLFNTTGVNNTANGSRALVLNTTGNDNTANGFSALLNNKTGSDNTANGSGALQANTTGHDNTANGYQALYSNTNGFENTATGSGALFSTTSGHENTANGYQALGENQVGTANTANGSFALAQNTNGNNNTAIGFSALGGNTGSGNIAIGFSAGDNLTTGNNNIDIGNFGVIAEANTIRIGVQGTQTKTFIAGIWSNTVSGGVAVYVNSSGQLGPLASSRRFKQDIHGMGDASDVLLALHPVAFRYKPDIDPQAIPQFGLIAEEVDKVAPELVARDVQGAPYSVRYEQVNAMLLNEFLKEHHRVEDLEKRLAELEGKLNKVSEQVEQSKAAPEQAANVRNQGGM